MVQATFALTEAGPGLKEIRRAKLWKKIVRLVEEEDPCVRHARDENIAVLEAVTQAFAASRVCTVVED